MKHPGRTKDGLYEPALADSEREAVADLLQYLENVRTADSNSGPLSNGNHSEERPISLLESLSGL